MVGNQGLQRAKDAKKDEFYTQLIDIEKELNSYKEHFENKTVLCNCDNPEDSNFWKYFSYNFDYLRLKRLIATHYETEKQSYQLEMYRDSAGVHTEIKTLQQNGDFRSPEIIELLKDADIVVTNPPFSLFREYIAQLVKYGKKFIILGNMNAVSYKDVFPLIRDNKIWLGHSVHGGDIEFRVPEYYPLNAYGYRVDMEGKKYIKVKSVRWFTNLTYKEKCNNLILTKTYNEKDYSKYDNYDAINVDKTKDIPGDYEGVMGVPITFIDKYNPEQFEILGIGKNLTLTRAGETVSLYNRIFIKKQ